MEKQHQKKISLYKKKQLDAFAGLIQDEVVKKLSKYFNTEISIYIFIYVSMHTFIHLKPGRNNLNKQINSTDYNTRSIRNYTMSKH